jgi:tRNA-dependent cyclodipeptide synthase
MKNLNRIKPVFKCPQEYKDRFLESTCLLTISVGQEVHEGDKFEATIDLINGQFKNITILIDDVLQRHSMMLVSTQTPEDIYQHSLEEGDLWLARNHSVYSRLSSPYNIIRWENWYLHTQYQSTHNKIKALYANDQEFAESFNATTSVFLERFMRRQPTLTKNYDTAFQLCLDYLFEECSALCLWVEEGYHFEVYPSQRNLAMSITHEKLIKPNHPNFLLPVAIKFKNRKQLKAQRFSTAIENELATINTVD